MIIGAVGGEKGGVIRTSFFVEGDRRILVVVEETIIHVLDGVFVDSVDGLVRLGCVIVGTCQLLFRIGIGNALVGIGAFPASSLKFVEELVIDLLACVTAYLDEASPEVGTFLLDNLSVGLTLGVGVVHHGVVCYLMRIKPVDGSGDTRLQFFRGVVYRHEERKQIGGLVPRDRG